MFHSIWVSINPIYSCPLSERPSPPGQPKVLEITAETATIEWTTPESDGGAPLINYIIEYRVAGKIGDWATAPRAEKSTELTFTVDQLREEVDYEFRVIAENRVGLSDPSPPSEPAKYGKFCIYGMSSKYGMLSIYGMLSKYGSFSEYGMSSIYSMLSKYGTLSKYVMSFKYGTLSIHGML